MRVSDLINLSGLIDDAKCFALARQHRCSEGVRCAVCGQRRRYPGRMRRHAALPAALSIQGVQCCATI